MATLWGSVEVATETATEDKETQGQDRSRSSPYEVYNGGVVVTLALFSVEKHYIVLVQFVFRNLFPELLHDDIHLL